MSKENESKIASVSAIASVIFLLCWGSVAVVIEVMPEIIPDAIRVKVVMDFVLISYACSVFTGFIAFFSGLDPSSDQIFNRWVVIGALVCLLDFAVLAWMVIDILSEPFLFNGT